MDAPHLLVWLLAGGLILLVLVMVGLSLVEAWCHPPWDDWHEAWERAIRHQIIEDGVRAYYARVATRPIESIERHERADLAELAPWLREFDVPGDEDDEGASA